MALAHKFDAVYLAPGTYLAAHAQNVFSNSHQTDALMGLASALGTYQQILWYLQTGVRKPKGEPASVLPAAEIPSQRLVGFSKWEVRQKAARCTKCDCNACVDNCVLLQQCGQSPLNLARDIGTSTNLFHETQGHAAMRQIGSCTDCGLCDQVCPVGIDIGKIIIDARHTLHDKLELPKAHHEYLLRDMAFANGPQTAVSYLPEDGMCEYLFFPGCQAGGSDPRYVSMTYERLCKRIPATGLLLRCCGNPALWAGVQTLFQQELKSIRQFWLEAGKPTMISPVPPVAGHLPSIYQRFLKKHSMSWTLWEYHATKQLRFSIPVPPGDGMTLVLPFGT